METRVLTVAEREEGVTSSLQHPLYQLIPCHCQGCETVQQQIALMRSTSWSAERISLQFSSAKTPAQPPQGQSSHDQANLQSQIETVKEDGREGLSTQQKPEDWPQPQEQKVQAPQKQPQQQAHLWPQHLSVRDLGTSTAT